MLLTYLLLNFFLSGYMETSDVRLNYILQFTSEKAAISWFDDLRHERQDLQTELLFHSKHIYSLAFSERTIPFQQEKLLYDDRIIIWQYDHPLQSRRKPNDPLFDEQWYLTRIEAEDAWNLNTGGITSDTQEIVIAILDDGFDMVHPDLLDNRWANPGETPNDGIDNDNNGFVDDFRGLNAATNNDDHALKAHGTNVAGIIGARGNNGEGISGINWRVKLLYISNVTNESRVIKGFNYIHALRKKYNDSGGKAGSLVVVANLSAGIDNAFPSEHPIWCGLYNTLGEEGILNVVSATNQENNVDVEGDIPTTCPSAFLITVTSSDKLDKRIVPSGYGLMHVDIAAPGTDILTTHPGNDFDGFSGNSAAAPQVAAAVGLLYSTPCEEFAQSLWEHPEQTALSVKSAILLNADQFSDFIGRTVSGGRLNLSRSMSAIGASCLGEDLDLEIIRISPNPVRDRVFVHFTTPKLGDYSLRLFDMTGRQISEIEVPGLIQEDVRYFDVEGLPAGTYVIQLGKGKNEKVSRQFVVY